VSPECLQALSEYDRLTQGHGDDHPKARAALMRVIDLAPREIHARMAEKARELGLIPAADGYLADGTPVYRLEDLAKQLGMTEAEAHSTFAQFEAEREAAGLDSEPIDPSQIHHVQ
jgi:hypothetical protein